MPSRKFTCILREEILPVGRIESRVSKRTVPGDPHDLSALSGRRILRSEGRDSAPEVVPSAFSVVVGSVYHSACSMGGDECANLLVVGDSIVLGLVSCSVTGSVRLLVPKPSLNFFDLQESRVLGPT